MSGGCSDATQKIRTIIARIIITIFKTKMKAVDRFLVLSWLPPENYDCDSPHAAAALKRPDDTGVLYICVIALIRF